MTMAGEWQATFYVHQQTFNLITHVSLVCNVAHDSFITHRHKIYAFTLPTLLAFLQVQNNTAYSPFQVHPVTTRACVFGILGYYLAFRACLCLPLYATHLSIAMTIFGSFSLASLVSLLLSDSWWHIKYIFYMLLAGVELYQIIIIIIIMVTLLCDKSGRRSMLRWKLWRANSSVMVLPLTYMDLMNDSAQH